MTTAGTSITLAWHRRSLCNLSFVVERMDRPEAAFVEIARIAVLTDAGAGEVTWTDGDLPPGATYTYRVAACDGCDQSDYTPPVLATTLDVPLPPIGLEAVAIDDSRVSLTWCASSGNELGYRLERAAVADSGISFVEIGRVGSGVTTFEDAAVAPGTSYLYRVFAYNGLGDSLPSGVALVGRLELPAERGLVLRVGP